MQKLNCACLFYQHDQILTHTYKKKKKKDKWLLIYDDVKISLILGF